MASEEYEQAWARLQTMLSHPRDSIEDDGYDLSQVAGAADFITQTEKNFLAERLVTGLEEGLSSGKPLRSIDNSTLEIAAYYIEGTPSAGKAIDLLQSAFQPENWDRRTFDDLHAIAFGLFELEFQGTTELWKSFYEHFKDDVKNSHAAFDVYFTGAAHCGLDELFAAIDTQQPAEWLEKRLAAYFPTLEKLYPPELVRARIREFSGNMLAEEFYASSKDVSEKAAAVIGISGSSRALAGELSLGRSINVGVAKPGGR